MKSNRLLRVVLATFLLGSASSVPVFAQPIFIMKDGELQKSPLTSPTHFGMGGNTSKGLTDWFSTEDGGALKLVFPAGQDWAGVWITAGTPSAPGERQIIDLTRFKTLKIDMRGRNGGEVIEIGIKSDTQPDDGSEKKFRVELKREWDIFPFPLESFRRVNLKDLTRIYVISEFVHPLKTPITVFVRSISLE